MRAATVFTCTAPERVNLLSSLSAADSLSIGLQFSRRSPTSRGCARTTNPAQHGVTSIRIERTKPQCTQRVAELYRVLQRAAIEGPYVLLGFSIGGPIERLYAELHPEQVSGMVIVHHAFIPAEASATKAAPDSRVGRRVLVHRPRTNGRASLSSRRASADRYQNCERCSRIRTTAGKLVPAIS